MPNKYNFEFNAHTPRARADITIYATGLCYVSTRAVKEHDLLNGKYRWGEDREQKVLALKRDERGKAIRQGRTNTINCPAPVARRYAGKYTITEQDGVLVLVPMTATAQG